MRGDTLIFGQRVGRLTVLRLNRKSDKGALYYQCRCDCGKEKEIRKDALVHSRTVSCGCYQREVCKKVHRTHGMSGGALGHKGRAPEYQCWAAMLRRCNTLTNKFYARYGGRGIKVCERWLESFANFYADMGPRPSPKHSIDRINNDGNYEPGNCRWATRDTQARNTRSNVRLYFKGRTQTVSEWTRELGFPREVIRRRISEGWPVAAALTTPHDVWSGRRKAAELRAAGELP